MKSGFAIHVAKENFKFSAAHFLVYPGFREHLHGHNYQVGVRIEGALSGPYVLDFGLVKKLILEIVGRLDGRTIVPLQSDCMQIEHDDRRVRILYGDEEFVFPAGDVCLLPIVHSSVEELARLVCIELRTMLLDHRALNETNAIEVSVAEAPGQAGIYRDQIKD
jgi:6-pyruvoyl-tetrahydropterin synthase